MYVAEICRKATGKDLCPRQRQVPDACLVAGHESEPPGGGSRACAPIHELFFTLSPDKSAIQHNIDRALILADKSAYNYYSDFVEKGYYNRIIAGNITQVVKVDSVVCDFNNYPYIAKTYAKEMIIRQSNVTERSLVTTCRLTNASRSDDNPNGFIIEGLTILENRDIQTVKR